METEWEMWPGALDLGAGWCPENGPSATHAHASPWGSDTPPWCCSAVAALDIAQDFV